MTTQTQVTLEKMCSLAGKKARRMTDDIKQLRAENAELKRKIRAHKQTTQKKG